MNTNTQTPNSTLQNRYLIASVESQKLAFPAYLVQDILQIERSQILTLPFYEPAFLGVIQHQNQVVPLISAKKILSVQEGNLLQPTLTAIRLNDLAEQLTGVALVVDQMQKSLDTTQLSSEAHKFQLTDIPAQIWQPQR